MRIGFFIDRFQVGKGGAEGYLQRLFTSLLASGDDPTLFSMDEVPADFPGRAVCLPGRSLPRGFREMSFSRKAAMAARKHGCQVTVSLRHAAQADFFQPHGGAVGPAYAARRKAQGKKPGWSWKQSRFQSLEKRLVENCRGILPFSKRSAEEFRQEYPDHGEKVSVLPLGIDTKQYSPRGRKSELPVPQGARTALFIGHDFELKGLAQAIRVVAACEKVHLLVFGRGRDLARWQKASAVAPGRVHFRGQAQDLAPVYRAADLLLHPTFYDPCSHAVLEALACGLPVVTTACNGAAEAAVGGIEVVGHPEDTQELLEAVRISLKPRSGPRESLLHPGRSWDSHVDSFRSALV